MSETIDWDPEQLVHAADRQLRTGEWKEAVELLRRALVLDEAYAHAHAMLALALLVPNRLVGADAESKRALELAGGSPYCHYARAATAFARGRFEEAWTSCAVALGGLGIVEIGKQPETEVAIHVLGAKIRQARGETELARELLERAIAWMPQRVSTRVEAAKLELAAGRIEIAASHANEALRRAGTDLAANVVAGEIELRTGDVAAAERHAQLALLQDSTDRDALRLWAAVKSRKQPATGWVWRAFVWVATRDDQQQNGLLVGSFLGVQLLMILANAAGLPGVQSKLIWVWLAFLLGIYYGPVALHKLVSSDAGTPDRSV